MADTKPLSPSEHAALVRARLTLDAWRTAGSPMPLNPRQLCAWETIVKLDGLRVAKLGRWWTENEDVECGLQVAS
jgi:hypothetical protein